MPDVSIYTKIHASGCLMRSENVQESSKSCTNKIMISCTDSALVFHLGYSRKYSHSHIRTSKCECECSKWCEYSHMRMRIFGPPLDCILSFNRGGWMLIYFIICFSLLFFLAIRCLYIFPLFILSKIMFIIIII
jgi:hypothetical protein